ncbi:SpoIIE family protein phosphatase [Pseudonocardia asaccharolytica]|uniref:PAS domain-containing protein n=1 Tax=Pseudonocardia asaccharolytica DSM 44247 = NBRC 16224 TaxID=1123024 RepID=A0A511D2H2_9PSEU|nr:SpoIIE family protein phosphatase [Pseudonocardia asaccharolytica]GEL17108.1 hypothetical protein PA7_09450 [Pseudonocardia asaccharolytica DSM 44247 = NBRC 16224]
MPTGDLLSDPERLAAVDQALPIAQADRAALDRLAKLAALVLDAPVGVVTLIATAQQYLVGLTGLREPYATLRRMPVGTGYCPATLLAGGPRYIEDAAKDPELSGSSGHAELGFVAYAGVPLRDAAGHLIGTLCVADTRARRWRPVDRRALEALAESVVSELALHGDIDRRQRLLKAFDNAPAAIAVTHGPDHVLEYRNPAYRTIFGERPPAGLPIAVAHPWLSGPFRTVLDQVLATGETFSATDVSVTLVWPGEQRPRQRFFDCSAIDRDLGLRRGSGVGRVSAADRGLLVVAVEVTDRVEAVRDLQRRARHQELLARASATLNRNLDTAAELRELARVAVPELADLSIVHRLARPVPPGRMPPLPVFTDRVAAAAIPGIELPPLATHVRWTGDGNPIIETIQEGRMLRRPIATPAVPRWSLPPSAAATIHSGLNYVVAAPVIVDGLVAAIVVFGVCHDRPLWTDDELGALGEIARFAGRALEHGLSYERTRASALVLQRSLLTDPPEVPGLELSARYQPAGHDEVGGDWYDAFPLGSDNGLAVVIGDVVGHDITAAAAMGQLRASLRTLALDRADGPAGVLDRLGVINDRLRITQFATLVHAELSQAGDGWRMRWAVAGHPPPFLVTPGARPRLLTEATGMALVAGLARPRTEAETALPPGSTLLLYTDGLVERPDTDLYRSIVALEVRAAAAMELPIEKLCDELLRGAPTTDDVALLAIRVPG